MATIKPFKAIRPSRDKASLVASRSYLTYSENSLKQKLETNPYTFLHIINPDYKENNRTSGRAKYTLVKNKFSEFIEKKILIEEIKESFYIYQQIKKNRKFIGIIACISIEEYLNGTIKIHEETITKRENMFKDYLDITRFNADPVLLTYNDNKLINNIIKRCSKERAEYEFTTTNKVSHKLWRISKSLDINQIINAFEDINNIYIADGHHRSASSALLLKEQRNKDSQKNSNINYFMSYLIPTSQLDIINFNRLIKLNEKLNTNNLISKIKMSYKIRRKGKIPYSPIKEKEISMYIDGSWYSLTYKGDNVRSISGNLDTSILSRKILSPILDIKDEKTNKNISFLDGSISLSKIQEKIDNKEFDIAFILQPIEIHDLKNVADNNEIMPPKSTYIHPKLRSGLIIYKID